MRKPFLATAFLFLALGCRDENPRHGSDGGSASSLTCVQVIACVDACTTDACTSACLDAGSVDARAKVTAIVVCAEDAGCGDDDACIERACDAELRACAATNPPRDGGVASDDFPARIEGTTRDTTALPGGGTLDSNADVVFVRDDAAGAQAGYPIGQVAFYRLKTISYRATFDQSVSGCTTTADESESFTDPDAFENNLILERVPSGGRYDYDLATSLSVPHPSGLVSVCPPPAGTSYGNFNSEHNVSSGTSDPDTDLETFVGTATIGAGGLRTWTWNLHAVD